MFRNLAWHDATCTLSKSNVDGSTQFPMSCYTNMAAPLNCLPSVLSSRYFHRYFLMPFCYRFLGWQLCWVSLSRWPILPYFPERYKHWYTISIVLLQAFHTLRPEGSPVFSSTCCFCYRLLQVLEGAMSEPPGYFASQTKIWTIFVHAVVQRILCRTLVWRRTDYTIILASILRYFSRDDYRGWYYLLVFITWSTSLCLGNFWGCLKTKISTDFLFRFSFIS